jgi:hypothetical protein
MRAVNFNTGPEYDGRSSRAHCRIAQVKEYEVIK